MLGKRKLIVDTFSEIHDLIQPWIDQEFWDLNEHTIVPGAIYVVGRMEFINHQKLLRELVEKNVIKLILSNPAEGSRTLIDHVVAVHKIEDLVLAGRILLISGGDMPSDWPALSFDSFLPKVLDYEENVFAQLTHTSEIFKKIVKPYKFLFLNGRLRTHRKFLIEKLDLAGLLDQSIWSLLDSSFPPKSDFELTHNGVDLMLASRAIKLLEPRYEVLQYRNELKNNFDENFVKYQLFRQEWGDIYINPAPYVDTYFSLVTETVHDFPYSFRTEKTWKPVAIGHPWIVSANYGFYRDIRNLGFKTFGHVIDESFDLIENNQDRINRLANVVIDLCQQDLPSFLTACRDVCKYNQHHLQEMRQEVRKKFPSQFVTFIKEHHFDE